MMTRIAQVFLAATLVVASPLSAQTVAPASEAGKLIATLKSNASRKEKADACRQLAIIGGKDAVAPLAALLTDAEMSHMARYALEPNPDPAVNPALRQALEKVQGRLLAGVIGSLGVRRDAEAVGPLAKFLQDADPMVAQAAARALGKIGTVEAGKALQNALNKVSPENRVAFAEGAFRCAEALAKDRQTKPALVLYEALRQLPSAPYQVRAGALRGVILHDKNGVAVLEESLQARDYVLFAAAAQTAIEMRDRKVAKSLLDKLPQLDADRQVVVIQTLGKRADASAVEPLTAVAKKGPKPVRLAAVRALGEIGQASAIPGLQSLAADSERDVARAAQEAFASLKGKQVDAAVVAMLKSNDSALQVQGIELVGRRRMTGSMPALLQAAKEGAPEARVAALRQVGDLGTPAEAPKILDILQQASAQQEIDAAEQALSALCAKSDKPEACVAVLKAPLASARPPQKAALLRVLTTVGGNEALATVRGAVKDPNPEVRDAAIRALGAWKTADAGPDLLELAKNANDPTQKTLSLRNYLSLASNTELPQPQRLAMCREAADLVKQTGDKKMLLGALGNINSPASMELIVPHLEDTATREEAATAILGIADRLLKGQNSAKIAPRIIAPLEKVSESAQGDLANRAKTLLQQARSKAKAT